MRFTVLGASGFIGSHLVARFKEEGLDCWAPARDDDSVYSRRLGHVIYCIGLTADARKRPFDAVTAHVCLLSDILRRCQFDSFLYLSSTRLYIYGQGVASEEDAIRSHPLNTADLFNISKVMGEAICFASQRPHVKVVRPSNVYGADFRSENFLTSIIRDALIDNKILLRTALDSAKDYIGVGDVAGMLIKIATGGRHRIYNLASGMNTSNKDLVNKISSLTGCRVEVVPDAEKIVFPEISIQRLKDEFGFSPSNILNDMKNLIDIYGRHYESGSKSE